MPRRQFVADLQHARTGALPPAISNLKSGDDDGQLEFAFDGAGQAAVKITVMISDVSDYPATHTYYIFCADDAPEQFAYQLQTVPSVDGKTILQLLEIVSGALLKAASKIQANDQAGDGSSVQASDEDLVDKREDDDDDDVMDDDYSDEEEFLTGIPTKPRHVPVQYDTTFNLSASHQGTDKTFRNRIRSDLRAVKDAGYRVSAIGNILGNAGAYVTISIRISKLGISEEALQAWRLDLSEYLVLIIYYPDGYKTIDQLQRSNNSTLRSGYSMRVISCDVYKPLLLDTVRAFQASHEQERPTAGASTEQDYSSSTHDTFISKPLIRLLEEQLIPILRFRAAGMDWRGAEASYQDLQKSTIADDLQMVLVKHYEREVPNRTLPAIVNADHYSTEGLNDHSFPLLAMQFTLRHFVRCVEFCLVCHRMIDSTLEAIKPYVCDRPLCLFQYMAMGFGPSIEHEILAQPQVVDLLISFCYSSADMAQLKDLPVGLGMMVPGLPSRRKPDQSVHINFISGGAKQFPNEVKTVLSKEYSISFDPARSEIMFLDKIDGGCPIGKGSWIVIRPSGNALAGDGELHCRVAETTFYPTITVDKPIVAASCWTNGRVQERYDNYNNNVSAAKTAELVIQATTPKWNTATLVRYDQDFDQLNREQKCDAICRLLDILPSIQDMQAYLNRSTTADLRRWIECIPLASLNLLRWIIASNRACIMQVDSNPAKKAPASDGKRESKEERLQGMDGYVQFRFAMGAPDKEERFMSAVKTTATRLNLKHPTIFAWHGSPLHNWHMIIREGLHFEKTKNGRVYGNGVYHSSTAATSIHYTGGNYSCLGSWPQSALKVQHALALNELVNAPREFVSSQPHYVVKQLDWIQTRYLLVKCHTELSVKAESKMRSTHPQDPERTPTGVNGLIVIPASAMNSGRVKNITRSNAATQGPSKKQKGTNGNPICIDGPGSEYDSDESSAADRELLLNEADDEAVLLNASQPENVVKCVEDFVPGALQYRTLPLMPMPTYATSGTTKRLMNELKNIQKLITASKLSELGWHVDVEKIENVYQWIVELHSFHRLEVKGQRLPLADDMKAKGITSVVIEVRFGPDFPFSPPYIRVVRPRFLSFAHGGGGHIVMGGAMCMELLTNSGWSGINSMESVLLQVRLAIASEPFARLDKQIVGDYGIGEAAEGFIRACRAHGWIEPPGFKQIAYGMGVNNAGAN